MKFQKKIKRDSIHTWFVCVVWPIMDYFRGFKFDAQRLSKCIRADAGSYLMTRDIELCKCLQRCDVKNIVRAKIRTIDLTISTDIYITDKRLNHSAILSCVSISENKEY